VRNLKPAESIVLQSLSQSVARVTGKEELRMQQFRKLSLSLVALAALAAVFFVASASASSPRFELSAIGTFSGQQTSDQVFTFTSGSKPATFTCKEAKYQLSWTTFEFSEMGPGEFAYSNCSSNTPFGKFNATVSNAQYTLMASGAVKLLNTITLHIGGIANCNVIVEPQTHAGAVSYTNKSGKIEPSMAVTGMTYTGVGLCASISGTNGAFGGSSLIERVGGGTISWQP
jgi:hypothetical protein